METSLNRAFLRGRGNFLSEHRGTPRVCGRGGPTQFPEPCCWCVRGQQDRWDMAATQSRASDLRVSLQFSSVHRWCHVRGALEARGPGKGVRAPTCCPCRGSHLRFGDSTLIHAVWTCASKPLTSPTLSAELDRPRPL